MTARRSHPVTTTRTVPAMQQVVTVDSPPPLPDDVRRRAALTVADRSTSLDDCRTLLDMLVLLPSRTCEDQRGTARCTQLAGHDGPHRDLGTHRHWRQS